MDERIVLTKEQQSAIRSLERAFKKCANSNIIFHNHYGTLISYDAAVVESVDDDIDELSCEEGDIVEQHGYSLASWADDLHYIHLIDA